MLDAFSFRMLLAALVGWFDQRQQDAVAVVFQFSADAFQLGTDIRCGP